MSDLLSPILYVIQNEVDAFWCFCGFMELVVRPEAGGRQAPSKGGGLVPHVAVPPAARELRGESGDNETTARTAPAAPEGAGPAALRFPG